MVIYCFHLCWEKTFIELFGLYIKLMPVSIDKFDFGDRTLGIQKKYTIDDAMLIRGYDSQGYGAISSNVREAIKELAHTEGILLDPVYSGRAFYGLLDNLRNNKLRNNSNVLFWHTGGLPANFHYSKELL